MADYLIIFYFETADNEVKVSFEKQKMIITVLTDDIINVFVPLWSEEHRSKAIEPDDMDRVPAQPGGEGRLRFGTEDPVRDQGAGPLEPDQSPAGGAAEDPVPAERPARPVQSGLQQGRLRAPVADF